MEKQIIFKYFRTDFFGNKVYAEDVTFLTAESVKKAFAGLKKDVSAAVEVDGLTGQSIVISWSTMTDYEAEIAYIRFYDAWNSYTDKKIAFSKARKHIYDLLKNAA